SLDQFLRVGADEIENADDIEGVVEHFGLVAIAGNAVEHERVAFGMKAPELGLGFDIFAPELDGVAVGHQFAFAGILDKDSAEFAVDGEIAEDIPAGAVIEVWNGAENLALGAFSRAGGANE